VRRTFQFHDLSSDEFESLVGAICQQILGTGAVVFAAGKDGGRDGTFVGTAQKFPSVAAPYSGKFVIQAKHTANPVASCGSKEFGKIVDDEKPKIKALADGGELEFYLVFTNRKKPATSTIAKEKALAELGLKGAHIHGLEQLRAWLMQHPDIWSKLGFDRFDAPLRIQRDDITAVIAGFHAAFGSAGTAPASEDFSYVPKPQKNKINKLSA